MAKLAAQTLQKSGVCLKCSESLCSLTRLHSSSSAGCRRGWLGQRKPSLASSVHHHACRGTAQHWQCHTYQPHNCSHRHHTAGSGRPLLRLQRHAVSLQRQRRMHHFIMRCPQQLLCVGLDARHRLCGQGALPPTRPGLGLLAGSASRLSATGLLRSEYSPTMPARMRAFDERRSEPSMAKAQQRNPLSALVLPCPRWRSL